MRAKIAFVMKKTTPKTPGTMSGAPVTPEKITTRIALRKFTTAIAMLTMFVRRSSQGRR